ncbi:hypothetical protein LWI28_008327 [Acer negundo]|uniref:Uncharacterized protein n=1 Tax=Acer negundo TaxID=4023 RepID=A0AAD5J8S3_ACENE|nr:hypothetical protein LWI28_008327 [Acer negundo]
MHNMPPNLTPPPSSSQPLSNPTSQHPTIEVSSNNTRTLPQHQQTISKSTPSLMKAPSEPPLEGRNAPDLPMEDLRNDDPYYVPPVITVPLLVDEVEGRKLMKKMGLVVVRFRFGFEDLDVDNELFRSNKEKKEEKYYEIHIKIIALTAHVSGEEANNTILAGMYAHLGKPLKKQNLLEAIR